MMSVDVGLDRDTQRVTSSSTFQTEEVPLKYLVKI